MSSSTVSRMIPDDLRISQAQIPLSVIGLIYSDGQRAYSPHPSLKDLYLELEGKPLNHFPDYMIMSDGSILVFIHQLFYQAFTVQTFSEPELCEMIDLSNLMSK